jgi:hypothetical protein
MTMMSKLRGILGMDRNKMSYGIARKKSNDSLHVRSNPEELGQVNFLRDIDDALNQAEKTSKPIFVLFQEIPGCSTCTNFARDVLTHPLMVEAIEMEFVAVAINNRALRGSDASALKRFGEPHFNNPVVRFLGADGVDLIDRREGVYSMHELLHRMIRVLIISKEISALPTYLQLFYEQEHSKTSTAIFSMPCYWQGERVMGSIEGVVSTWPGWINASEVVSVLYNPKKTTYCTLLQHAYQAGFGVYTQTVKQEEEAHNFAILQKTERIKVSRKRRMSIFRDVSSSERKHFLKSSAYRSIPMLPIQSARINAGLGDRVPDTVLQRNLSPRQRQLLAKIRNIDGQARAELNDAPDSAHPSPVELATSWNILVAALN